MQVRKNPDGTITVRIARGPEGYDPNAHESSGGLYSEETISAAEFKEATSADGIYTVSPAATAPNSALVELINSDPSLRDLIHLGDSEIGHQPASRPAAFKALDKAAAELNKDASASSRIPARTATSAKARAQVVKTGGSERNLRAPGAPLPEPEHPSEAAPV